MQSLPKLKVVIVAPSTRSIGGQSAQALYLINHWKDDPSVSAELLESDPKLPRPLGFLEGVPFLRTIVRFIVFGKQLWVGLRGADVAHIFSASYWAFVLVPTPAMFVARLHGVKTIIHYHSGEARDHLERWRSATRTLRAADCVVVPSGYLAEIFGQFAISTTTISNGIDCENFHFYLRDPLRPRLVCTRAFEPYYRVDLVIRAFEIVKKRFPEGTLSLVGSGTLEPTLKALVSELGLASSVTFAGEVGNQRIHRFYDDNDVFVNASEVDNLPVSILEAFASGTVVASTSPGGIPFLVDHGRTGLLSEPGSPDKLAQNVIRILEDPESAAEMTKAAYEECKRRTWPVLRQQWMEHYSKLVGDSRGIQIDDKDSRTIDSQTHAG